MQRSDQRRLLAKFKERLIDGLSDIDFINSAILERQSLKYKGRAIDFATEGVPALFDESGAYTNDLNAFYDAPRINGFLKDIITLDTLNRLTEKERLIFEAVCNKILVEEELQYTNAILESAENGALTDQEQAKIETAHKDLTDILNGTAFHVLPFLKTYLLNNHNLYPLAHECKTLTEYLAFLRRSNLWEFYIPPASTTGIGGIFSRIFNECPTPPHLKNLLGEIEIIIKNPDHLEENLSILLDKLQKQAYLDLFDEEGNIHEALFAMLPETDPLTRDDDNLKKLLLNAYFTSFISESLTPILSARGCRNYLDRMVTEIRHDEHVETPVIAMVTRTIETRNQEIAKQSFGEIKAKHTLLQQENERPYEHDAPRSEPNLEVLVQPQARGAKPSFFQRHPWVKYALIGAAVAVAAIGIGFAAAATFGVLPAVLGAGAAVGGLVGLHGAVATGVGLAAVGVGFTAVMASIATGIGKLRDWVTKKKETKRERSKVAEPQVEVKKLAPREEERIPSTGKKKRIVVFADPGHDPRLFQNPETRSPDAPESKPAVTRSIKLGGGPHQ